MATRGGKTQPLLVKNTGYSIDGKPVLLTKQNGQPKKKARHAANWFPEETKIQVATLWAATRSFAIIKQLTTVPEKTVRSWMHEPWWFNLQQRVVKDKNDELDQKLTQVLDKCADLMVDRLENGNHVMNWKTGEVTRLPMHARDIAMSLGIIFDKRQLIRGEATSRSESVSSTQKLEELKQAFVKFSEATEIEGEVRRTDEDEDDDQPAILALTDETDTSSPVDMPAGGVHEPQGDTGDGGTVVSSQSGIQAP